MALIIGTNGPDTLLGSTGEGADTNDVIRGRAGNDLIEGLGGNDLLFGGPGDDTVFGDLAPPTGPGQPPPSGPLPGSNILHGGAGNDLLVAGFGADTVFGGPGDDTIRGYGATTGSPSAFEVQRASDGPDLLLGGAGNDSIDGGGGADRILGGRGDDTLLGGAGVDTLTGGQGSDVFRYERLSPSSPAETGSGAGNRDVITDFQDNRDHIEFLNYGPLFFQGPQPESLFLGTGDFVPSFGLQVRYQVEGDHTVVQFAPGIIGTPPEGTQPTLPTSILEIELSGVHHLTTADFLPELVDRSGGGEPQPVDWNALAAQVLANFAATGQWFL